MRVIYTAGVWDLFHTGHLNILKGSKDLAGKDGKLIVGVVTDLGAASYKGKPTTINEHDRLRIVSAIQCVDAAFLQPGTDPSPVLRALASLGCNVEVMTHGNDWTELREGGDTLEELGISLHLLSYTPDVSTTVLFEKIRASA